MHQSRDTKQSIAMGLLLRGSSLLPLNNIFQRLSFNSQGNIMDHVMAYFTPYFAFFLAFQYFLYKESLKNWRFLVGSERAEFWWNCSESDKSMKYCPDIVHMVLIKIRSGGTPKIDYLTSYWHSSGRPLNDIFLNNLWNISLSLQNQIKA